MARTAARIAAATRFGTWWELITSHAKCLLPVGRLTHHLEPLRFEQLPSAPAKAGMVVDDENAVMPQ